MFFFVEIPVYNPMFIHEYCFCVCRLENAAVSSFGQTELSRADEIRRSKSQFSDIVQRVRMLFQDFPHEPIRTLLVTVENLPCDSAALEQYLLTRKTQLRALATLHDKVAASLVSLRFVSKLTMHFQKQKQFAIREPLLGGKPTCLSLFLNSFIFTERKMAAID
jgi:hypothetical protein